VKIFQKGFVVPLLLTIIGLLIIGGGVYLYIQNKQTPTVTLNEMATTTETTNQTSITQTPTNNPSTPTITINQNSLATISVTPTITGTAMNVPFVRILLPPIGNDIPIYDSGIIPTNGTYGNWSVTIMPNPNVFGPTLVFGTYLVQVYGYKDSQGVYGLGLLASSTLTVNVWQSNPSATIDQNSLTQPENVEHVITGTASNTNKITLYIANFTENNTYKSGYQSFGYIEPVNGRWSSTLPDSNIGWSVGTYPIEVRDMNGVNVLANGTLTISAPQQ
jgi:hypothetical protein